MPCVFKEWTGFHGGVFSSCSMLLSQVIVQPTHTLSHTHTVKHLHTLSLTHTYLTADGDANVTTEA